MARIETILKMPELEGISANVQGIISFYVTKLQQKQQEAMQQQQLLQNAQQFQQQLGGPGQPGPQAQGAPPNTGTAGNQQVNPGELIDESMPGA